MITSDGASVAEESKPAEKGKRTGAKISRRPEVVGSQCGVGGWPWRVGGTGRPRRDGRGPRHRCNEILPSHKSNIRTSPSDCYFHCDDRTQWVNEKGTAGA